MLYIIHSIGIFFYNIVMLKSPYESNFTRIFMEAEALPAMSFLKMAGWSHTLGKEKAQ